MFEDSVFDSAGKRRTRKPVTVVISFALQTLAVGVIILIPLLDTEALPARQMLTMLMAPPPRPALSDRPARVLVAVRPVVMQRELTQPNRIPEHAIVIKDDPQVPIVAWNTVDQTGIGVDPASTIVSGPVFVAPPPPPPQMPSAPERISGTIMAAKLIYQLKPVYPALARQVHVQGTVRLQAVINKEGAIENLTVISGHPLLIPAALDAVRQWRYQPTLLSGAPVEVETTIDVTFILGG